MLFSLGCLPAPLLPPFSLLVRSFNELDFSLAGRDSFDSPIQEPSGS